MRSKDLICALFCWLEQRRVVLKSNILLLHFDVNCKQLVKFDSRSLLFDYKSIVSGRPSIEQKCFSKFGQRVASFLSKESKFVAQKL